MNLQPRIILAGAVPPPHHGSTIYFERLLRSQVRDRFNVHHLDLSDHRDLSNLSKLDLTNVRLALGGIVRMIRMLLSVKPDIVYVPFAASALPFLRDGLLMLAVRLFSNAKLVVHFHGGNYFQEMFYSKSNTVVRWFVRYCLHKTDVLITLGDSLHETFHGIAPNIVTVPNGIPYRPSIQSRSAGDRIRITFLGNLIRSKGILDLLAAVEILLKKRRAIELHIIGAWWERDTDVKETIVQALAKYRSALVYHGQVLNDEKFALLDASDIFVLPTSNDGFPLSLLEAMSSSLPVISSRGIGAVPDIVRDGETGILIGPGDIDALVTALDALIENAELRLRMGTAGRQRYEKYFLDSIHYDRMIDVFESVLG
jgi:glycosyltransferase involved in cell wall biosynthesis